MAKIKISIAILLAGILLYACSESREQRVHRIADGQACKARLQLQGYTSYSTIAAVCYNQ